MQSARDPLLPFPPIYLLSVRKLEEDLSVSSNDIPVNDPLNIHGVCCQSHAFQLNLALSKLVILAACILILDSNSQNHVVQSGDCKGESLIIDWVVVIILGGGFSRSIVNVLDLLEGNEEVLVFNKIN